MGQHRALLSSGLKISTFCTAKKFSSLGYFTAAVHKKRRGSGEQAFKQAADRLSRVVSG